MLNLCHLPVRGRRPIFRICVLYVEEDESVKRQLQRGEMVGLHAACCCVRQCVCV